MIEVRVNHMKPHAVEDNPYSALGFVSWYVKFPPGDCRNIFHYTDEFTIRNMHEYTEEFAATSIQDYRFVLAYTTQRSTIAAIKGSDKDLSQVVIPTIGEIVAVIDKSLK